MWVFIITVSAHDGCLVVVCRQAIRDAERNPIGRWLIRLNGGDIWLLLGVKAAGTVIVSASLLYLYWWHPRWGMATCSVIAAAQLLLLIYLYAA